MTVIGGLGLLVVGFCVFLHLRQGYRRHIVRADRVNRQYRALRERERRGR